MSIKTIASQNPTVKRPFRIEDLEFIWQALNDTLGSDDRIRVISGFDFEDGDPDNPFTKGVLAYNGQLYYYSGEAPDAFDQHSNFYVRTEVDDTRTFADGTTQAFSYRNIVTGNASGGTLVGIGNILRAAKQGFINMITSDKIASNAITTTHIANGAVTSTKLATDSVTSDKIADGAVVADRIADLTITTAKLATGAVTNPKIDDGSVTATKLADASVQTSKLATGAVNTSKLSYEVQRGVQIPVTAIIQKTGSALTLLGSEGQNVSMIGSLTLDSDWSTSGSGSNAYSCTISFSVSASDRYAVPCSGFTSVIGSDGRRFSNISNMAQRNNFTLTVTYLGTSVPGGTDSMLIQVGFLVNAI